MRHFLTLVLVLALAIPASAQTRVFVSGRHILTLSETIGFGVITFQNYSQLADFLATRYLLNIR